jgi:hypothetical protein
MNTGPKILMACFLTLLLAACAAGGIESGQAAHGGMVSHFFLGFWHGIIAPFTLMAEIGHKLWPHTIPWTIRLYETRADSVVYDIGFFLGLGGGPAVAWRRYRRD